MTSFAALGVIPALTEVLNKQGIKAVSYTHLLSLDPVLKYIFLGMLIFVSEKAMSFAVDCQ